jgi:hypothetical protein
VNVVVYRSTQNTQSTVGGGLIPIRLFPNTNRWAAVCYVDSYVTRNNADILLRLGDFFGSSPTNRAVVMMLNNFTRESFFGAAKTNFGPMGNWNAANEIFGGVLKKLRFVDGEGGVVRCYDSRSTTAPQKSSFQESGFVDFLDTDTSPVTDAEGQISLVHIGAYSTGAATASVGPVISRFTGQQFTFQKFGFRVFVAPVSMTSGDNDLSAFTPVILTEQLGIVRTESAINAATTVDSFQDLLEELHVLALAQVGAASYSAFGGGNLFTFEGGVLTTNFTTVNVDATAASKISYNSATNTLTLKSAALASNDTVQSWRNASGSVNLLNGAQITGIYTTSSGTSTVLELRGVKPGASYIAATNSTKATILFGVNNETTAQDYPIFFPPGSAGTQVYVARKGYGDQLDFEVITLVAGGMWYQFVDIPDEGVTEPALATVLAYTSIETTNKLYDYIGAFQTTEAGIKLANIVVRAGPQLQFGDYSGLVKQDAASVFGIAGDTITLKANGLAKTNRYTTIIATPPAVWEADTNEVLDLDIEDANGNSSVTIQAAGVSTFEIWKVTDATAEDDYEDGTLLDTVGTGKYRFLSDDGFKLVIRDQATNYRVTVEMEKGVYTAELFFGAAVQLAQSATVELMYTLLQTMGVDMSKVIVNQNIINGGVKKSSLLIPHTNNTNT